MRLSWPFNLFQRKPADADSARGSSPPGPPVAQARRAGGRNEWRQLPAIAETIGPPPLVAPNAPFAADLGAGVPPPPVLKPLAHGHGLDAPAGIVVGLARPIQRAPQGPSLPPAIQRRPTGSRAASARVLAAAEPELDVTDRGPLLAPPEVVVEEPPTDGVQRRPLDVVSPTPAAPRPSLARLSELDEARLPLRSAGVIGQPTPTGAPPAATHLASPASPVAVAPASPKLDGPVSRKPASAPPPALDLSARTRPTLGQSRRLGLGAPITTLPTATIPATALPAPSAATIAPAPAAATSAPEPASAPLQLRRGEPVQRRPIDATDTTPEPRAAASDVPAQASPMSATPAPAAGPAPRSVPLASARAIRPQVQRAPLRGATRVQRRGQDYTPDIPASPSHAPVRVHRGTTANEMADSIEAKAFTHKGEVYLPSSAGPLGSSTARSLLAHEMTHVAQQRTYGSRLPQEHSSLGQKMEAAAVAAEKRPGMPLAQPPSPPKAQAESAPADLGGPAQRRPSGSPSGSPHDETITVSFPGAQRAPAMKRDTDAEGATGGPRREPRKSDRELEELASQLYGRISRRLRRELMTDRERAGLMVDLP